MDGHLIRPPVFINVDGGCFCWVPPLPPINLNFIGPVYNIRNNPEVRGILHYEGKAIHLRSYGIEAFNL